MKKAKSSKIFLEALRKVPVVQVACDKAGVSRNTVYRWKREDEDFATEFDKALQDGIEFVNDMSESQLLQLIKDRSFSAVRYWLNHNHNRYKNPHHQQREVGHPELSKERMNKLKEDITRMNNMWFEECSCSDTTKE